MLLLQKGKDTGRLNVNIFFIEFHTPEQLNHLKEMEKP